MNRTLVNSLTSGRWYSDALTRVNDDSECHHKRRVEVLNDCQFSEALQFGWSFSIAERMHDPIKHSGENQPMLKSEELPRLPSEMQPVLDDALSVLNLIYFSAIHALRCFEKRLSIVKEELDCDSAKDSANAKLFRATIRLEFASFRDRVDQIHSLAKRGEKSSNWSLQRPQVKRLIEDLESLQIRGTIVAEVLEADNAPAAFALALKEVQKADSQIKEIIQRTTNCFS